MIRPFGGHDPSLERFLNKVPGIAAQGAVISGAVAAAVSSPTNKADGVAVPFPTRPQPLAVARQGGAA